MSNKKLIYNNCFCLLIGCYNYADKLYAKHNLFFLRFASSSLLFEMLNRIRLEHVNGKNGRSVSQDMIRKIIIK